LSGHDPALPREGPDLVDFYCNDYDALVQTVSPSEVTAAIEEMRIDKGAESRHSGAIAVR